MIRAVAAAAVVLLALGAGGFLVWWFNGGGSAPQVAETGVGDAGSPVVNPVPDLGEAGVSAQWLIDEGARATLAARDGLTDDPDAARVFVDFDGGFYWGDSDKPMSVSELREAVSKHTREDAGRPVWVEWHRLTDRIDLRAAVAAINEAGAPPVLIEGEDSPPPALVAPSVRPPPPEIDWDARPSVDKAALSSWLQNAYPAAARRERREGDVTVAMCVGADGQARDMKLIRSSGHADLDKATLKGIPTVRFKPARDDKDKAVSWCDPPYVVTISWRMPK